jgi:mycofactocin system creatininase family protein
VSNSDESGLARLTWPAISRGATVLVPTGSTEQHGPHLPFETDSVIAGAVAEAVAERLGAVGVEVGVGGSGAGSGSVLVSPTVTYGASGEHQAFAGTMSIGHDALQMLLIELVRSLSTWAGRVVFVNGHGGNVASLVSAVRQLRDEGHNVSWVPCVAVGAAGPSDAHAGRTETSLMLHLAPDSVVLDRLEPGNTENLSVLMGAMSSGGVAAVSPNGILGDPRGASAVDGEALFERIVEAVAERIRSDRPNENGLLQ